MEIFAKKCKYFFFYSTCRKKIDDFLHSREVSCIVHLHDVSSAVSSAICSGLHVGVQSTKFSFAVFPGVAG